MTVSEMAERMAVDIVGLMAKIAELRPNPLNVRGPIVQDSAFDELVASIRAQGILQPLVVTPEGVVVAGHRRLAAAQAADLERVPVIVRRMSEAEQITAMLTENLLRQDLSPLQEAMGYRALIQSGLARSEVARQVGVHQSRVGEHLLLLELDPLCQQLFGRRELPVTLVRHLAKIEDPARQRQVASLVAKRLLTVLDVRQLVETEPVVTKPAPVAPKGPSTPRTASRVAAVKAIREHAFPAVPVAKLDAAMEGICSVCEQCGCQNIEVICAACPLPAFVVRVLA